MTGLARYVPGDFLAVLGPATLVTWEPRPDVAVDDVWRLVSACAGVHELIEVVAGDQGWSRMPAFALVHREPGRVRALVRGDVAVHLTGPGSAPVVAEAPHVATWLETVVDGVAEVSVQAGDRRPGGSLPIVAGAVPACLITWSLGDSGAEGSRSAPVEESAPIAEYTRIPEYTQIPDLAEIPASGATVLPFDEPNPFTVPAETIEVPAEHPIDHPNEHPNEHPIDHPNEHSVSYDYLFGGGEARSVFSAAIRPESAEPDDEPHGEPADSSRPDAGEPAAPPPPPTAAGTPVAPPVEIPVEIPVEAPAEVPEQTPGLISHSPWSFQDERRPAAQARTPAPVPQLTPSSLFSGGLAPEAPQPETTVSAPAGAGSSPADPATDRLGDHDDLTVRREQLPAAPDPSAAASDAGPTSQSRGPEVLAVACPRGDLNAPESATCRICAEPIPHQTPFASPRPALGVLRSSTGEDVELDRMIVVGRQPRASGMVGTALPRLLTVPSPNQDISRSHLEIRIEGWQVLVADLDSLNGTVVTAPGRRPQRLRAHTPVLLAPGSTITLADEVTLSYEVSG